MGREVRYARSGTVHIAYQVVGDGPIDLVLVPGWVSNIDVFWEEPALARFLRRLASFTRLILFDKRGTGLSDRVTDTPSLEERMDDVRAVMDAVGSERAALLGYSEGGVMCLMFAAMYPERTRALITMGCYTRRFRADDYPYGLTREESEVFIGQLEREWGGVFALEDRAPSRVADPLFREWWARMLRMSASPTAAAALTRANRSMDVRAVLPSIRVPTLLLHARGDRTLEVGHSEYMAERIAGAKLVVVEGNDHLPWLDCGDAFVEEVRAFISDTPVPTVADRVVSTILFTDIVDSTGMLAEIGDHQWGDVLEQHNDVVRRELTAFGGRELNTTGDGFIVAFNSPAQAIRCAQGTRAALGRIGLEIRAGLHTGECEEQHGELVGLAVHIASRIADIARPRCILVSRTVRDLVTGSGIAFSSVGLRELRGVPEPWELYEVGDNLDA